MNESIFEVLKLSLIFEPEKVLIQHRSFKLGGKDWPSEGLMEDGALLCRKIRLVGIDQKLQLGGMCRLLEAVCTSFILLLLFFLGYVMFLILTCVPVCEGERVCVSAVTHAIVCAGSALGHLFLQTRTHALSEVGKTGHNGYCYWQQGYTLLVYGTLLATEVSLKFECHTDCVCVRVCVRERARSDCIACCVCVSVRVCVCVCTCGLHRVFV